MWQPKPDISKRSNKGSIYKQKNGEITPPCLTPFAIVKYLDFTLLHRAFRLTV